MEFIRNLRFAQIGLLLAFLLVAWQPFTGGARPASLLLFLMGAWLVVRERRALFADEAQRRWLIVFLLLFVPVLVSIPASYGLRSSALIALVLFLFFFAGITLIRVLREDSARERLAVWISILIAVWTVDGLIQYFFGRDIFGIQLGHDGRVVGIFADNLRMSLFIALLLPLALYPLLHRPLAALIYFALAATVAVMGGARMLLVMLFIAGLGLFMHLPRWRWKLPMLGAAAVLVGIAVATSPMLQNRFSKLQGALTLEFEGVDRFLSYRLTLWDTAGQMFIQRPLTGVGAGAFDEAYREFSRRPGDVFMRHEVYHAHQLYVSVAAETGVIGLFGIAAIIALCLKWLRNANPDQRRRAWPFALGLLVYAFPVNSQPPLFQPWFFPVLLLLMAGFLGATASREK